MSIPRLSLLGPIRVFIAIALLGAAGLSHAQPTGFAVNSRGNLDNDQVDVLWSVDLRTGQSTRIGKVGSFIDVEGLALAADGTLYGADDSSKTIFTINPDSGFSTPLGGALTNMGMPTANPLDVGLSATCSGDLLMVSDVERSLYTVNLNTGQLSRIGEAGSLGAPITDIAVFGDLIVGIGEGMDGNLNTAAPNLYRIDLATATAEQIGTLGNAVAPYTNAGLSFDAEGGLWALTDRRDGGSIDLPSQIVEIDPGTGNALAVRSADLVGFESLAVAAPVCGPDAPIFGGTGDEPPAIPVNNPATLMLMILMLMLTACWTLTRTQR